MTIRSSRRHGYAITDTRPAGGPRFLVVPSCAATLLQDVAQLVLGRRFCRARFGRSVARRYDKHSLTRVRRPPGSCGITRGPDRTVHGPSRTARGPRLPFPLAPARRFLPTVKRKTFHAVLPFFRYGDTGSLTPRPGVRLRACVRKQLYQHQSTWRDCTSFLCAPITVFENIST